MAPDEITRAIRDPSSIYAGCPHRETISRAANNKERLRDMDGRVDVVEKAVIDIRIAMARQGFISGAGGGIGLGSIGGAIFVIGKAAGWW